MKYQQLQRGLNERLLAKNDCKFNGGDIHNTYTGNPLSSYHHTYNKAQDKKVRCYLITLELKDIGR